jgi:hypothetical protein
MVRLNCHTRESWHIYMVGLERVGTYTWLDSRELAHIHGWTRESWHIYMAGLQRADMHIVRQVCQTSSTWLD